MKRQSIQKKISVGAGICVLLTAFIIISYAVVSLQSTMREAAMKEAIALARGHATDIATEIESALNTAQTLAQTLSAVKDIEVELDIDRDKVMDILRIILDRHPQFAGVYTCWEPDGFDAIDEGYIDEPGHDETGRFAPYWKRNQDGKVEVETLLAHPAHSPNRAPGQWYDIARTTRQDAIIQPFTYQVAGREALLTTLVAPIIANKQFYGVVGIDLELGFIQTMADTLDIYDTSGELIVMSSDGTLVGVTGKPDMVGSQIQDMHKTDYEEDLAIIRQGDEQGRFKDGELEILTPLRIGGTTTPWSVNIVVPEEKITAEAQTVMWRMIWISLLCVAVALTLLWFIAKSITNPLVRSIEFAESVAKGDLTVEIDIDQKDEIGILTTALREMRDRIRDVLRETTGLIQAVQDGELTVRGNADAFHGGWQALVVGMNDLVDAFVLPLNVTAEYIERLSKSDIPEQITEEYNGDFNTIKDNLNMLVGDIRSVLNETTMLSRAIQEGKLETRGSIDAFGGGWREIVIGVNQVIDAFMSPLNVTAEYLDRIAKGDIPQKITEAYSGDFNEIKNNLNGLIESLHVLTQAARAISNGDLSVHVATRSEEDILAIAFQHMIETIRKLIEEMNILVESAVEGRLGSRGDVSKFNGDYAAIVSGVNATLDAVIEPLNVAAEYVARISRGDIPDAISEEYKGDFNDIKRNLNRLIDTMSEVTRLAGEIAGGNLTITVEGRSDQDTLMQELCKMVVSLNSLVGQIQRTGVHVGSSSTELAATARQQEATMSHQMESTNAVVAAVTEISEVSAHLLETVQHVASMSQETAELASNSQTDLEHMGEAMGFMERASVHISSSLESISQKTDGITTVVTTITKVADQTNLLSLNAAIEAEKAGEYGRGFTVVAREIRRLADQTAVATLDIEQMVQEMQSAVATGVMEMDKFAAEVRHNTTEVERISTQLTRIIEQVQALSPSFEEVKEAMAHQSHNAHDINTAMMNLREETQETRDALHETYSTIEQLNETTRNLQDEVSRFEVQ